MNQHPRPGVYRHFKGGLYVVKTVGELVDSDDEFVVYQQMDGPQTVYIRNKNAFVDKVVIEGKEVSRFTFLYEPCNERIKRVTVKRPSKDRVIHLNLASQIPAL